MDNQLLFENRSEFRRWLKDNSKTSTGIWMVFGKPSELSTIRPDEALEEALCFGWIDGQIKSIDDTKYIKKFSPRRKDSKWSEKNRGIAAQLIKKGQMTELGLAAIEQAKQSGNWDIPKSEPISDVQISTLVEAIRGFEPAFTNFMNMSTSVRRTYAAHYLAAKSDETKNKRLMQIVARLNDNKKPM